MLVYKKGTRREPRILPLPHSQPRKSNSKSIPFYITTAQWSGGGRIIFFFVFKRIVFTYCPKFNTVL